MTMQTRWGKWKFNEHTKVLNHFDAPTYDVDLESMRTSAEMLDWIFQLHGKCWVTHQDMGDLIDALWYLFSPQSTLCSDGQEQGPKDFVVIAEWTKAMHAAIEAAPPILEVRR